MDKVIILKEYVEKIMKDAHKFFERKNKAAGVRVRKKLQKCKVYAQEIRNLIQKSKNEHAQKKAAISANAVASKVNEFVHGHNSYENNNQKKMLLMASNSETVSLKKNKKSEFFFKETVKKPDSFKFATETQNFKKIEEISNLDNNLNILK